VTGRVHVIGAGLAGLAAALRLSSAPEISVTLSEATNRAGGRCHSFEDASLGRRLDNGNHLMLSGNRAVRDYLRATGAEAEVRDIEPRFPFVDVDSGARWDVAIPSSPFGMLRRDARPPGARPGELSGVIGLLSAARGRTVAEAIGGRGEMWRAFWEPITLAVINAPPERADAALLARVLRETFVRGAAASRPILTRRGLSDALVAPAVGTLGARGVDLRWRRPLRALETKADRVVRLVFDRAGEEVLGPDDAVVLAVPPAALAAILPGVPVPPAGLAIANAHFRVPADVAERLPPIIGLLASPVHWIFRRGDVLSTTSSGVDDDPFWDRPREAVLADLWRDVAVAAGCAGAPMPPARLITERGATFDQSPAGCVRRPAMATRWSNLVLAGDHTATGLPATIEGALRSGFRAADALAPRARRRGPFASTPTMSRLRRIPLPGRAG
jgi:squalene-associated FAD-dependent desaturase